MGPWVSMKRGVHGYKYSEMSGLTALSELDTSG